MDTVKDLFFLHERGFQSGVLGMVFILFSTLAPLICGFLVAARGWPWYHWLVSILAGVNMLLIFFCFPETNYKRDLHQALDDAGAGGMDYAEEHDGQDLNTLDLKTSPALHIEGTITGSIFITKSYIQQLKPWSPVDPEVSVWWPFIRPWITLTFPAVIWATLAFAAHVAW
jgi:MFS family permease